jgi:hypothetical protein
MAEAPLLIQGFKNLDELVRNGIVHEVGVVGAKPLTEIGSDLGRKGWLAHHGFRLHNLKPFRFGGLSRRGSGHNRKHALSSSQI